MAFWETVPLSIRAAGLDGIIGLCESRTTLLFILPHFNPPQGSDPDGQIQTTNEYPFIYLSNFCPPCERTPCDRKELQLCGRLSNLFQ
jgi:hypothetical protein